MDWFPYRACCQRFAGEADVAFCPECGHPFLRCMAFAECGSLVSPTQACPVCVAPALMMDAGAVIQSKRGERLSVPLILRNNSPGGRPIWVKQIFKLDGQVNEPIALTWEQIDPQTERHFRIDTPPMAEGGTHGLRLLFVIASRYRGVEEVYAFSGGTSISVSGQETGQHVVQNINLAGATFETGGMVHTTLSTKDKPLPSTSALADRTPLPLERAERYELESGIRGYADRGLRVPRNVEFGFTNFRSSDVPPNGSTMVLNGRLAVGRNSRTPDPAANAAPSDIALRVYDRSGKVDEPATRAISRHHFDFIVVNDRLCVHTRTSNGMELSGTQLTPGAIASIKPGDRLVPINGRPDKLTLQVAFTSSIGSVDRIIISRAPGMTS